MKKIIIGIITLFLLTSCYSNPKDIRKIAELEKQIQESNTQETEFIFNNNLKCHELEQTVLDRINEVNIKYQKEYKLNHIFYSKKTNSCLYIRDSEKNGIISKYLYEIGNDCDDCKTISSCSNVLNNCTEFDEEINKFKN